MEEIIRIPLKKNLDGRGSSFKSFDKETLNDFGVSCEVDEIYCSISHKNVIRGMHFQTEEFAQAKLLSIISGSIKDILIDMRKESVNLGKIYEIDITKNSEFSLYIPKGFAHGFKSLEDDTTILYALCGKQLRGQEKGIFWNSFGYDWKIKNPILSDRDRELPTYEEITKGMRG